MITVPRNSGLSRPAFFSLGSKKLLVGATISAAVLIITLVRLVEPSSEFLDQVLVLMLAWSITYYCYVTFLSEMYNERLFSPLSCYSAIIVIHFTLPAFFISAGLLKFRYLPNSYFMIESLLFVFACFTMMHLGSFFAYKYTVDRRNGGESFSYFWGRFRSTALIVLLLLTGWVARGIVIAQGDYFQIYRTSSSGEWHALRALVEMFPMYSYVIYLVAYFHRAVAGMNVRTWIVGVSILGMVEFSYWMVAGRKFESILVLLFPVIIRYIYTRLLPKKSVIIIGLISIVLMFPATFYYRYSMESGLGSRIQLSSVPIMLRAAADLVEGVGPAAQIVGNRLNRNEAVTASMRLIETREWRPRFGIDYAYIAVNLIPRFLWPGKPDFHYGTDFGQAAGITAYTDNLTSVSVTYFGEAYLNFLWGGCIVFLIFGFVAEKIFSNANAGKNPVWVLLYCLFLPPMLYIGGTVAMAFGGFLKLMIMFSLLGTSLIIWRRGGGDQNSFLWSTKKIGSQWNSNE